MKKLLFINVFLALVTAASAQSLRVVNAASLSGTSFAPGSIITIYGSNLAAVTAAASSAEFPPTALGGVTVTIGGSAAQLFYVTPTQINAVVNPATPMGNESLAVTSATGTQTATVTVSANAAPGLFSLFGTGLRDGAILNAITSALGAFSVTTGHSSTFLELFATGLNTTVAPTVTIGGVPAQVTYYGPAPCCDGLQQINLILPASVAGAGRVPVVLTSNGAASNTVEVVLLPSAADAEFPDDGENASRSRELASLAYVPGTSLLLSSDEEDDVVRVIDISSRKVTHVMVLPKGSKPQGIAVTANGATAVVVEAGSGKAAILDLTHFTVMTEVVAGAGAARVAITGSLALVVNSLANTATVIDLASDIVLKTIGVGNSPEGIGVDSAASRAYVVNENDGTVSVIDLGSLAVVKTLTLGASVRAESIAVVPGAGLAFLTAPAAGPHGEVVELNLTTGEQTVISANPSQSGGSSDVAFFNGKLYFANQTGASVSVASLSGSTLGAISTVKAELGARAIAVDVKDNLLVVSNEGTGNLTLIDLSSNKVVGHINAVKTDMQGDDGGDDHSDRN